MNLIDALILACELAGAADGTVSLTITPAAPPPGGPVAVIATRAPSEPFTSTDLGTAGLLVPEVVVRTPQGLFVVRLPGDGSSEDCD